MLPDLPKFRQDLDQLFRVFLETRTKVHLGWFGEMRQSRLFEGNSSTIVREDGLEESFETVEISEGMTVTRNEILGLTPRDVLERLDRVAEGIAAQKARHILKAVSEAAESVGNVFDGRGKPLSHDMILAGLEQMWIEFDPHGRPLMPSIVTSPAMKERVDALQREMESDPELRARFDRVIDRKREEWRAREARRELVG